jgi:hypothetical protein
MSCELLVWIGVRVDGNSSDAEGGPFIFIFIFVELVSFLCVDGLLMVVVS